MTTAAFRTKGARVTGFTVCGHSGTADAGEDLVCAAVTSAVRLVEATVNDVLGIHASVSVEEDSARVTLRLPSSLPEGVEETCQALLTGMMVYFSQLHVEHPGAVEVLEEDS